MKIFSIRKLSIAALAIPKIQAQSIGCAIEGATEKLSPECKASVGTACEELVEHAAREVFGIDDIFQEMGVTYKDGSEENRQLKDEERALTPCEECPSWPPQWQG